MRVLALDTACSACSAAMWADGAIIASRTAEMTRGHTEVLIPMVLDVVSAGPIPFAALDLVAVTLGPGSFTGLRTGLAAAKGIALAHDLPLIGITSLEAVALAARRHAPRETDQLPLVVVLETRRGSVYLQKFAADMTPLNDPCSTMPEEVVNDLPKNGSLLAGDAACRIVAFMGAAAREKGVTLIDTVKGPDAGYVAEIAAGRWDGGIAHDPERALTPLYVQAPEARRPRAGGRLRS